jgi:hypothetical protein
MCPQVQEFPKRRAEYSQASSIHFDAVDVPHSIPKVNGSNWYAEVRRGFARFQERLLWGLTPFHSSPLYYALIEVAGLSGRLPSRRYRGRSLSARCDVRSPVRSTPTGRMGSDFSHSGFGLPPVVLLAENNPLRTNPAVMSRKRPFTIFLLSPSGARASQSNSYATPGIVKALSPFSPSPAESGGGTTLVSGTL